jgi:hypothetical protein
MGAMHTEPAGGAVQSDSGGRAATSHPLGAALYGAFLAVCAGAWVRSAWMVPLRNYPFDFSINYTGARLLHLWGHDGNIYDRARLAAEAAPYTSYTALYTKLFLTYIQTPLTAVLLMPVSGLSLDAARATWLAFCNVLFVLAAVIMIYTLRPTWLLVGATFLIFATFEAMFDSLRLGQVDAVIVLMLALAFLALRRGRPELVGMPLAAAAILKVSPVVIIGYFAWRRSWRVVAGAALGGAALLALSLAIAGRQNHVTFVRDTLPMLSKGSTFYDNVSLGGALARAHFGAWSWYLEDVVPDWPLSLRLVYLALTGAIVLWSYIVGRRDAEAGFMLSCAVAVLVAPISWSFYPVWLLPSLLFLVARCEQRRAWGRLAMLAALYPCLAIVPAHFSVLSDEIYRWPLKTIVLALYCGLLAWEAQAGPARHADEEVVQPTSVAAGVLT